MTLRYASLLRCGNLKSCARGCVVELVAEVTVKDQHLEDLDCPALTHIEQDI